MTTLPQSNATLTRVARGGTSEDYDDAPGADATAWEGNADAYFGERRATLTEGQNLNRERVTYLIVPGALGIVFSTGDTVTFARDGEPPQSRDVRAVRAPALRGIGPWPIRLDLSP